MIRSHFGVVNPDARVQRPEYLGGKRIPIQMNQVVQTSSTDATSLRAMLPLIVLLLIVTVCLLSPLLSMAIS